MKLKIFKIFKKCNHIWAAHEDMIELCGWYQKKKCPATCRRCSKHKNIRLENLTFRIKDNEIENMRRMMDRKRRKKRFTLEKIK